MNDLGVNVAQVLDDCQSSYMNNDEYIRFSRVEEYQQELAKAKFDLTKVLVPQNNDDAGLDTLWGEGIKMNWSLVPLEEQKCHIAWRQSISNSGIGTAKLASWLDQGVSAGYNLSGVITNETQSNIYIENQADMSTKFEDEAIGGYAKIAIAYVESHISEAQVKYANDLQLIKNKIGSGNDLDPIAVLCAHMVLGTSYEDIVKTYREVETNLGNNNPALVWTAVGSEITMVKRWIDGSLKTWLGGETSSSATMTPATQTIPAPNIIETNLVFTKEPGYIGNTIESISIHHAGYDHGYQLLDIDVLKKDAHEYHISKGWAGVGYHFLISQDGKIYRGRPEDAMPAAVEGHNTGMLAINCWGNFNNETPTQEQIDSLTSMLSYLCNKYSITPSRRTIKGHKEYSGHEDNSCPGNNLYAQLDEIVKAVAENKMLSHTNTLWTTFSPWIKRGLEKEGRISTDSLQLFPSICYLYVNLLTQVKTSDIDGDEWAFPFTDEQIKTFADQTVYVTGWYQEQRNSNHAHEGVDLQPGGTAGYDDHYDIDIHAMKDGVVVWNGSPGDGWELTHGITIKHPDNTFSRYLHCKSIAVSKGQNITKGQVIGKVGCWGSNGPHTYAFHLHVEMGEGDGTSGIEASGFRIGIDPITKWKGLKEDRYVVS